MSSPRHGAILDVLFFRAPFEETTVPSSAWNSQSFAGMLSEPTRRELLRLGVPQTFQAGELLVLQGEPSKTVYLMLSGRVSVLRSVENGAQSLLGVRYPGDLVGEMSVLGDGIRSATVMARERSTLLVIPPQAFLDHLRRHPESLLVLNRMTGDRLTQSNAYRADAAGYEVEARLARALLYQSRRMTRRENGHPSVDLKQSELAMLIGAKEGTVHKALKSESMKSLVLAQRGRVLLLDVPGLARLAEVPMPEELR